MNTARPAQTAALEAWLQGGPIVIGQIRVSQSPGKGFILHHVDDDGHGDMEEATSPGQARTIAMFDDNGAYRPLKSAPSLRHGWRMRLPTTPDLLAALDHFYPAAVGMARALENGQLAATSLRETLDRQTGMYRVAGKLDNDGADQVAGELCQSATGCLRRKLWDVDVDRPVRSLPKSETAWPDMAESIHRHRTIPLLCREACCLFVAAARKKVKSRQRQATDAD